MYTLITSNYSVKEFVEWKDLLSYMRINYYNLKNVQISKGQNYVELYSSKQSIYVTGLNQNEISYFLVNYSVDLRE
jgi:hypothetical protein